MSTTTDFCELVLFENGTDYSNHFAIARELFSGESIDPFYSNIDRIDIFMKNASDRMLWEFQDTTDFVGGVTNTTPTTGVLQFGCTSLTGFGNAISVTYPVAYPIGSFPTVIVWIESPDGTANNEIYQAYIVYADYDNFTVHVRKTLFVESSITESDPAFSISIEDGNILPNTRNFYIHWMSIGAAV